MITITPATAGNKIRLQFTTFEVETGYDWVYIYDGTTVNTPLIGAYNSGSQPGTVYGTSASGALMVRLTSDGVVQMNGFAATIGCVTTVPTVLPDLTLQGATVSPTSVVAGGSVTANCTIYDLSGAMANSSNVGYLSTDAVLDAADQLMGNTQGFALPVGQSSYWYGYLTVPAGTAPGTYYVLFAADYLGQVSETNNLISKPLQVVTSGIDLTITQAALSATSVTPGFTVGGNCYIQNGGNAVADSNMVGYYLSTNQVLDASDVLLTTTVGASLYSGQSAACYGNLLIPTGTAAGNYHVRFVADPQNAVAETNENNNLAALPVTVLQALASREQTIGYTVSVLPNPVVNGGALRVQLSGAGISGAAALDLYNALGQRVRSQPL